MKQIISQQNEQQDFESLSIDVNQTVDVDQLNATPLFSHYFENVFSLEDFYMLRAVFYFYLKQYNRAILDYQQCQQLKNINDKRGENSQHEGIDEYTRSKCHSSSLSRLSSKTDLSDVGLCSLNEHETNFNILLCFLMIKNKDKCLEIVKELIKSIPQKYQKYFYLIRGLMYECFNQTEKSQKDLEKYKSLDPKGYEQYFTQDQEMLIEPFPTDNRLCSQFNNVSLKIVDTRPALKVRPSFSMPFIRPPNMIPNIDEDSIQEEFNLKQIDAPMPEAPWIKRCQYGIKFTDEVQDEDADSNEIGH